jgi:AraC-like DNA-binding protein
MHTAAREVTFEEFLIPASEFADAATPSFKLCLVLEGDADLSYRLDDRPVTTALRPGMFAPVTPPSVEAKLGISRAQRHLMIEIGAAALRRAAEDAGHPTDDLGVLHDRPFHSPLLTQLSTQALREHRSGDGLGTAFVDAMQDVFMLTLLRLADTGRHRDRRPHPALPDALVEKIRCHCLDRLEGPVTVSELAAMAGLGTHQFTRSFRAAVGRSPQQYVIALRLSRAQHLLSTTALPIAEVALRCGFFDQAHLASTFTRATGLPPSRYRRLASA